MAYDDRWVYGRADDRAMDDDRLNGTAANLQDGSGKGRHPAGRNCFGIALGGLVGLGAIVALVIGLVVTDFSATTGD
jgi:hypothetical protein